MPELSFKCIAASESEDKYPTANLLTGRRAWRGKAGIEFNFVILKLPQEEELRSIDIGNDGSAYISVSVAKSCQDIPTYNCLISETAFMDPGECRMERNLHRVKLFPNSEMNAPFSGGKWDLIKVVCKQPYNRRIPCGLSFIQLIGGEENKSTTPVTKLGIPKPSTSRTVFNEVENQIQVREQQAKENEVAEKTQAERIEKIKEKVMERARQIRAQKRAHNEEAEGDMNNPQVRNTPPMKDIPICTASGLILDSKGRPVNPSPVTIKPAKPIHRAKAVPTSAPTTPTTSRTERNAESSTPQGSSFTPSRMLQSMMNVNTDQTDTKKNEAYLLISPKRSKIEEEAGPSTSATVAASLSSSNYSLHRVVFSLSGFENPLRSQLRDKGTALGATYAQNIDSSLTHLICAFKNTPKAKKAGSSVKIVSRHWIERSFAEKRRMREELFKI